MRESLSNCVRKAVNPRVTDPIPVNAFLRLTIEFESLSTLGNNGAILCVVLLNVLRKLIKAVPIPRQSIVLIFEKRFKAVSKTRKLRASC